MKVFRAAAASGEGLNECAHSPHHSVTTAVASAGNSVAGSTCSRAQRFLWCSFIATRTASGSNGNGSCTAETRGSSNRNQSRSLTGSTTGNEA